MDKHSFWITVAFGWILAVTGCGTKAVSGGTTGQLWVGSSCLCDIQVTVYRIEETGVSPVGFGISGPDGCFALLQNDAAGPLWLPAGDYCCTVESVGPVPVCFPNEFRQPAATPLRIVWEAQDRQLDLELPTPIPCR